MDAIEKQPMNSLDQNDEQSLNAGFFIGCWFVLWSIWLSSIHFIRGPLSFVKIHVNGDGYVSHAQWFAHHATHGAASLLDPSMCGVDRLADFGMPSIFEIFCVAGLPVPAVYVLLMICQRFIAGWFTYKLLSEVFKSPKSLAILGGMAFSLGATRGENVGVEWIYLHFLHEPGFPLLLYAVHQWLSLDKLVSSCFKALALGLFLALTSQTEIGPVFTVPCAYLFGLIGRPDIKNFSHAARFTLFFVLLGGGYLLYQWPHFVAAVSHAPFSARSSLTADQATYERGLALLKFRMAKMVPHVILTALWLITINRRSRPELALLLMLIITVIGGVFLRPFLAGYSDYIGFFASFNTDRLFLYAQFFLVLSAVLAVGRFSCKGYSLILRRWDGRQYVFAPIAIIALLGGAWIANLSAASFKVQWRQSLNLNMQGENWHRLYASPELKALAQHTHGEAVRTVTLGAKDSRAVWQPTFNLAYGLETADGYKMIYPNRYHQFWRAVVGPAYEASETDLTRMFMDRFGSRLYLFPTDKTPALARGYHPQLLSLANVGYLIATKPVTEDYLEEVPAVYPQSRLQEWSAKSLKNKVLDVFTGEDYLGERLYIYKNLDVFPRVFSVTSTKVFDDTESLLQALQVATADDLRKMVYLDRSDGLPTELEEPLTGGESAGFAQIEITAYDLEKVEVRVNSESGNWIVLSNVYSPYWQCKSADQDLQIIPAYRTFMAVHVPAGHNDLTFSYDPPYKTWVRTLFTFLDKH